MIDFIQLLVPLFFVIDTTFFPRKLHIKHWIKYRKTVTGTVIWNLETWEVSLFYLPEASSGYHRICTLKGLSPKDDLLLWNLFWTELHSVKVTMYNPYFCNLLFLLIHGSPDKPTFSPTHTLLDTINWAPDNAASCCNRSAKESEGRNRTKSTNPSGS